MKELLKEISRLAIPKDRWNLLTAEQIKNEWLGNPPASVDEIKLAEQRLGVILPEDYKEFLLIANGFSAPNDIEPGFEPVDKINFLENIDPFLVEVWNESKLEESIDLARSILIAGIDQEQYFLLIPPAVNELAWKYWKFANWIPGVHLSADLTNYFKEVLGFMKNVS